MGQESKGGGGEGGYLEYPRASFLRTLRYGEHRRVEVRHPGAGIGRGAAQRDGSSHATCASPRPRSLASQHVLQVGSNEGVPAEGNTQDDNLNVEGGIAKPNCEARATSLQPGGLMPAAFQGSLGVGSDASARLDGT